MWQLPGPRSRKTAAAAVSALVISKRRVLLVRRAHPPLRRQWSLPGGRVEPGETPAAALARELCEETGLRFRWAVPFARVDVGRGLRVFRISCFRVTDWTGRPRAADDALAVAWVPLRRVAGMVRRAQTLRVIMRGAALPPRERRHCILARFD